ncbi:unnamed protein product [Rangifer tarandus platyrhynchus]|uniref:Secreted protein n=1 Tax=Rangifer tarandus platyrhynchus TaxID=3082113 RepID=A0ABN8XJG7_RANTA|nr:unnamed protein product [Rangifer tarandus platyrhynchus]
MLRSFVLVFVVFEGAAMIYALVHLRYNYSLLSTKKRSYGVYWKQQQHKTTQTAGEILWTSSNSGGGPFRQSRIAEMMVFSRTCVISEEYVGSSLLSGTSCGFSSAEPSRREVLEHYDCSRRSSGDTAATRPRCHSL